MHPMEAAARALRRPLFRWAWRRRLSPPYPSLDAQKGRILHQMDRIHPPVARDLTNAPVLTTIWPNRMTLDDVEAGISAAVLVYGHARSSLMVVFPSFPTEALGMASRVTGVRTVRDDTLPANQVLVVDGGWTLVVQA